MIRILTAPFRRASLRVLAGGLLLTIGVACSSSEGVGPSAETTLPTDSTLASAPDTTASVPGDSTAVPVDSSGSPPVDSSGISTAEAVLDSRSPLPGIVFASDGMPIDYFNSVHNGTKLGGPVTPSNVLSVLAAARAKKGRLFLKLCKGRDSYVKNADGTFSFTKWKALIDGYRTVNLAPYISDGTLIGHFLIDEPHRAVKWGGKVISHATLEAMAQYSKAIWPSLTTVVHTQTPWLANTPVTYRYLDAGWTQYAAGKGDVTRWVTNEVAAAQSKRLGLVIGLNVLDGGNGSSGIRGPSSGKWTMSATELKTYGTVVLNQSYGCAFFMWAHDLTYYGRTDIRSAMAALSVKAAAHAKTSCQQ